MTVHLTEDQFKEVTGFAMTAAASTRQVPTELIEGAIAFGEDQLTMKNGRAPSLDEALAIEGALRELRALCEYRKALDKSRMARGGLNGSGQ